MDDCKTAGDYESCSDSKESCKVNPDTGTLQCVEITAANGLYQPCANNSQCDVWYGCHFGKCTNYCEIQFQGAECGGTQCKPIGHEIWGSCMPLQ